MHAATNDVSAEAVRELLAYCPETGEFHWKDSQKNVQWKRGRKVGTVAANGYVMIRILGKVRLAHRLAWLLSYGEWPEFTIDHVNHQPHDNRLANLRDVPHAANARNHPSAALLVGATRGKDGTWDSGVHQYGAVQVSSGFATPSLANSAYLAAQARVQNPDAPRPKLRRAADRM